MLSLLLYIFGEDGIYERSCDSADERLFRTENGEVILNLYPLVPPSMIFMFRRNKRTVSYMNHKYHIKTILLYPTKEAM